MVPKVLLAFDFDHTVIDDNSDLYIRKLAPNEVIPDDVKIKYSKKGWTEFMGAIFAYLHQNGTTKEDMTNCMKEIPFTEGMEDLFEYMKDDLFEVVIISDSNSWFIDVILEASGLRDVVSTVYTNPAKFDSNGCLTIEYYHTQDWCDLSTVNLCKGHILEEHIKQAKANGVTYTMVGYVGDGGNDLCPSLRLRTGDIIFARKGYALVKKLASLPAGHLAAEIVAWDSGLDIKRTLESLLTGKEVQQSKQTHR